MSTLDMDLIFVEILPRLPAKPLIRFKCVSKAFQATIASREFGKLYLRHLSLTNADNLLILPENRRHIICFDISSYPLTHATAGFDWDPRGDLSLVGSCNGLLCFYTRSAVSYYSLLNPHTGIYKYARTHINGKEGCCLGFAFDHENLDFKIVEASDYGDKYGAMSRVTRVYSSNTNSWKRMETASPTNSIRETDGGVVIDNHLLHWVLWSPLLRKHVISFFDVCKINWTDDVLLPRYYYDSDQIKYLGLGVLDDRLSSSFENLIDSCFDVWVMNKIGVQDSWIKLFSIPVSNDLTGGLVPVSRRSGSNDVLIRHRNSSRLFWYNTTDGGMSEATFNGAPDFSKLQVCTCSSSLVDIPRGKLFERP